MKWIVAAIMTSSVTWMLHAEKISVLTTTPDVADITRQVVGDFAKVTSLTTGREEPHALTAKPSFILRARSADVWVRIGLELEVGWEPVILRDARNPNIQIGASHHMDVSEAILRLDVPTAPVTRDQGDIHPLGNPHYWLDPLNGRLMAETLARRFAQLYPEQAERFQANARRFQKELDVKMFGSAAVETCGGETLWKAMLSKRLDAVAAERKVTIGGWVATLRPFAGWSVVTYHRSWLYLLNRFDLRADLQLEPKPGIPPSAKHLAGIIHEVQQRKQCVILQEPYYPRKAAERVADETRIRWVVVPNMTGGSDKASSYLSMLDNAIHQLAGGQ